MARRRGASVPPSAVDVTAAAAPQAACVLARGDGHTAKAVERRIAATGPRLTGNVRARTPRSASGGDAAPSSVFWQLLG